MDAAFTAKTARRETAYLRDVARAFGGALLFNLPLLMTMEMWAFGSTIERGRLLAFVLMGLPLLLGVAHYAGFSDRRGLFNDGLDTLTALAVGFATAAGLLLLFGVLNTRTTLSEGAGQVALQAVPGAMGALLARRQLSGDKPAGGAEDQASYLGELFLMAAGALFLALNLAPTEEMILIAYKASPGLLLSMIGLSLVLLHVIVFQAGFAGQEDQGKPVLAFFHFTVPGYAIALLTSLFMLWAFGRTDGHGLAGIVSATVVLSFPAAIGAAAARLLV